MDPRNVLALTCRGNILHLRKEFDQALQALEQAGALAPDRLRIQLGIDPNQ